jgi:hypothetical protein
MTKEGNMGTGTSIFCGCSLDGELHHSEKLGEIRPLEGLVIHDRRNRIRHMAVVSPMEVLQRLSGTLEGSAVIEYVKKVIIV